MRVTCSERYGWWPWAVDLLFARVLLASLMRSRMSESDPSSKSFSSKFSAKMKKCSPPSSIHPLANMNMVLMGKTSACRRPRSPGEPSANVSGVLAIVPISYLPVTPYRVIEFVSSWRHDLGSWDRRTIHLRRRSRSHEQNRFVVLVLARKVLLRGLMIRSSP